MTARTEPLRSQLAGALLTPEAAMNIPVAGRTRAAGALTPTPTIATGYAVYPFVGVIEPGMRWTLQPREVEQVIELSLASLRAGFGRRRLVRRGIPILTDAYTIGQHLIWGATARILSELIERVAGIER